nr:MAG TPA: hypothetical protein [Caudoviricetes sp.]
MAYKTWTFTASIGSTNTTENHVDYINEGSVVGSENYILSGQKGTIDLVLHVNGTQNQTNWKACTTVEMVLMSAPAAYPRLSKYQQKRVISEKITTRNTTDGGGSCTLTAENASVLHAGNNLYIGAVGYDSTGAVVRTTNMQYACTIEQGADVEELTDGAQASITALDALKNKLDASGYTDAVGEIPVVNAAGNLKVRPVEFAIDNNDNFVLRGTESQVIASIPKSQLCGAGGSSEPEKVSNAYWSGYKYADGRMTLKSVQKKSFLYGWHTNKVTGVTVSSSTITDDEVFPVGFSEPPVISLMHTAGSTDYTGIYLYTDYARCTADASDNTYKLPPEPKFCYTEGAEKTGGFNNGTFYLIAEGRWK